MDDNALISVIVPVYNVENYLYKCISSIITQSYGNFELILIDDGSIDKSGEICDSFSEKDNRIKVIHKVNEGVSSARNYGLKQARGEYICFVDSDAYVLNDYLLNLINCADKDIDFVLSGFKLINGSFCYISSPTKSKYTGKVDLLLSDFSRLYCCYAPYGKLFKRNIIVKHRLLFDAEIYYGEDRLFVFEYLSYVNKVAITPYVDYCYCRRDGSLISKIYSFKQEYYAYQKSIIVVESFLNKQHVKDSRSKKNIFSLVADFANRVLNTIYGSKYYTYKERMCLLQNIDISLIGKYSHPVNIREWIIKYLFLFKQVRIHDFLRIHKQKWLQLIF